MKKMIINENQKGFLFKNGKYTKMLDAGKYYLFGGKEIEISCLEQPIVSYAASALLKPYLQTKLLPIKLQLLK